MEEAPQAAASSSSSSSVISESPSSIQYTILKNELKTIDAKLKLVKALIFERQADVRHTPDLESTLRQYVELVVLAKLTELGMETSVESTGSIELLSRMHLPPGHEAHIPEESTRIVVQLLDKLIEPNLRRAEMREKINDIITNTNHMVLDLQQAIADYNNILVSQAQELKSKKDAISEEYARLKKKIQLKLAKINLMKALSCNLIGLGDVDFLKNEKFADGVIEMRKPLNFHNL